MSESELARMQRKYAEAVELSVDLAQELARIHRKVRKVDTEIADDILSVWDRLASIKEDENT